METPYKIQIWRNKNTKVADLHLILQEKKVILQVLDSHALLNIKALRPSTNVKGFFCANWYLQNFFTEFHLMKNAKNIKRLASLVKWLSVSLWTKWFCRLKFHCSHLNVSSPACLEEGDFLTFRQLLIVDSLNIDSHSYSLPGSPS